MPLYTGLLYSFLWTLQQHGHLRLTGEWLIGSLPTEHMAVADSVIHMLTGMTKYSVTKPHWSSRWAAANNGLRDVLGYFLALQRQVWMGGWGLPRKASHWSSIDPEHITVVSTATGGLIANHMYLCGSQWEKSNQSYESTVDKDKWFKAWAWSKFRATPRIPCNHGSHMRHWSDWSHAEPRGLVVDMRQWRLQNLIINREDLNTQHFPSPSRLKVSAVLIKKSWPLTSRPYCSC